MSVGFWGVFDKIEIFWAWLKTEWQKITETGAVGNRKRTKKGNMANNPRTMPNDWRTIGERVVNDSER